MKFTLLQSIGIEQNKLDFLLEPIKAKGYEVDVYNIQSSSNEEIIDLVKETEVLMMVNTELSADILGKCTKLKLISIAFTAFDQVDIKYCKGNNITVCNSAGYSTNSVAELTFGFMISLLRKLKVGDAVTRVGGTREGLLGSELFGKTIGIIGTGTIGLRVAEIAKAFGCNLLGYSRTKRDEAKNLGIEYVDLDTLLKQSDVVTIHTPLNSETKELIGEEQLAQMKPSAFLINTARGPVVDSEALYSALKNNQIAGAALDVFDIEPPLDTAEALLGLKNVVFAPHVAFFTREALDIRADIAFKNVYKWLEGNPQNIVS